MSRASNSLTLAMQLEQLADIKIAYQKAVDLIKEKRQELGDDEYEEQWRQVDELVKRIGVFVQMGLAPDEKQKSVLPLSRMLASTFQTSEESQEYADLFRLGNEFQDWGCAELSNQEAVELYNKLKL